MITVRRDLSFTSFSLDYAPVHNSFVQRSCGCLYKVKRLPTLATFSVIPSAQRHNRTADLGLKRMASPKLSLMLRRVLRANNQIRETLEVRTVHRESQHRSTEMTLAFSPGPLLRPHLQHSNTLAPGDGTLRSPSRSHSPLSLWLLVGFPASAAGGWQVDVSGGDRERRLIHILFRLKANGNVVSNATQHDAADCDTDPATVSEATRKSQTMTPYGATKYTSWASPSVLRGDALPAEGRWAASECNVQHDRRWIGP